MASCIERRGALLLALACGASGCVTGHLFDAGRRWERAVAIEQASVEGERLLVAYTAEITDDQGEPLGRRRRRAAVSLADVRAGLPTERVRVEPLSDDAALGGAGVAATLAPAADGPATIELGDGAGAAAAPPLYASVLTRHGTEPWVYPLVPAALAVDAVAVPVLLFFAPGAIVVGD
jgi:hypothetical protein